jgi:hypothetical protein
MGPIGCTETSVKDYHWTLRKIAGECRSHERRGGSLKLRETCTHFSTEHFKGKGSRRKLKNVDPSGLRLMAEYLRGGGGGKATIALPPKKLCVYSLGYSLTGLLYMLIHRPELYF